MSIKGRAEGKTVKCKACDREAVEKDFCRVHLKAYENILDKYEVWTKALQISWREYLSEIEQNPLTGEWTKEVAKHITNSEETRYVKES
jgi:hypothetical protein